MAAQHLTGIQFGVLTDEQIRNIAVLEVTESTLHTKGVPKANGPADARFGTCSRFYRCGTCKHSVLKCPGHPGYISLPYPLPHVAFVTYMTRILNLFCFNCSAYLMVGMDFPETAQTGKKKLVWAYEEARKARGRKRTPLICSNPECGLPQPTVYVEEPFVKLAWREDLLVQYFGADVVLGHNTVMAADASSNDIPAKRRKKIKKSEAELLAEAAARASAVPAEPTAEDVRDRERRQAEYDYFVKRPFTNWDAYNVLKSIRRSDLALLGIDGSHTHPSGFMMLSLLVPAIGVRPTVSFEEGSKRRGYHQLTRKISDIIKQRRALLVEATNAKVRLQDETLAIELPETVKHELQLFYTTISHYLIKDKCKVPGLKLSPYAARAHARSTSISQALNGKNGRYRAHLMGKRVDFCMRTVVTPNPNADIDQIGIPEELAQRLTVPIRVNPHNREALQKLMAENGVMQVVDERTGDMIGVGEHNRDSLVLMDGWVVERFLKDNDWMPINRQPTLHRPSIMGHRVKIHKKKTMRLSDATMTPYNADCDGDEMNGHVPQTPEARAEVQELLAVPNHMIHPRANRPVIGLIQDGLDAGYFLTHRDRWFTRAEAMNLLMAVHYDRDAPDCFPLGSDEARWHHRQLPPPGRLDPHTNEPHWSGKQVVSCVLPRVTLERKLSNRPTGDPDAHLVIRNGEIISGTLCKQTLGTSSGGIIHLACMYCGNNTAARFISDMKRLLNRFLISMGFSVGIRDCMTDLDTQAKISVVVAAAERHVANIKVMAAEMPYDLHVQALAEGCISDTLKTLLHMVGNVVRANLNETNMFNVMTNIVCSKGSVFNMAQVMALVGPTFVNGMRPSGRGINRILPSAPLPGQEPLPVSEELRLQGFISRPYKAGLSMQDAFLHNMGGREGLVDTAAKTSRTGYLQRRIVKAMESHHIGHDGSVRDAYQKQYQRWFGHDALDPMKTLKVTLPSLMLDNAALRQRCVADHLFDAANPVHHTVVVREWMELLRLRDETRRAKVTPFHTNLSQNLAVYIPFDIAVLINEQKLRCQKCVPLDAAGLVEAAHVVDALCTTLESEVPCLYTLMHIRDQMSSGRLARDHQLCQPCVLALCKRMLRMHRDARIQPGEGVGALTATSTGEPATQMTLNSVAWDTMVLLEDDGKTRVLEMGRFIDVEVEQAQQEHRKGIEEQANGTIWVPLTRPVRVPSCDEHGVVQWDLVEAVTRHPVVNEDGTTDLLRVETDGGRSIDVTMGESMLRWDAETNTIVKCRADRLTLQDCVPVTAFEFKSRNVTAQVDLMGRCALLPSDFLKLDYASGFFLGLYAIKGYSTATCAVWRGQGHKKINMFWGGHAVFSTENGEETTSIHSAEVAKLMSDMCGESPCCKKVPDFIYNASFDCVVGFIDGVFADSNAVCSESKQLVEGVAALMRQLGVYTQFKSTDTQFEAWVPPEYLGVWSTWVELFRRPDQTTKENVLQLAEDIRLDRLGDRVHDTRLERIKAITRVKYTRPWAYDLTVARTRNMQMFNGLNCVDTFHTAGSANKGMTQGVPRMKEIIGASKHISTPVMTLPLKPGLIDPKRTAEVLVRSLPFTLLRNILKPSRTVYEPDLRTSHMTEDLALVREHAPFLDYVHDRCCPWVIRFELCKTRSGARSLEPRGVADLIQDELGDGALVIASRAECEQWIIRVYLLDVEPIIEAELKKSLATGTTRTAAKRASQRSSIASRKRRKFADLSEITTTNNTEPVLPVPLHLIDPAVGRTKHGPRDVIEWMMVRNTQQDLMNNLRVCGIRDIEDAAVRVTDRTHIDPVTGAVRIEEEYVVDVSGSNLAQVAMLHVVDMRRIVSNHVLMVYDTLGITAASQVLFQELHACLGASGSRVDERLIKLVVDVMTHNGFVMPISRHGLNRLVEHGVLAKITFEETLEMLFEAAALGYFDPLLGVSENTMVGRQARLGTNLSRMMMDRDDGERVECSPEAKMTSTAGPDTRILTSVVTEQGSEDFVDDDNDDTAAAWEETLDRILTVRNIHSEQVHSAFQDPTAAATSDQLYEQHFFYQPQGGTQGEGLPPLMPEPTEGPFRPSSPTLVTHEHIMFAQEDTEPFRPTSPTFD